MESCFRIAEELILTKVLDKPDSRDIFLRGGAKLCAPFFILYNRVEKEVSLSTFL